MILHFRLQDQHGHADGDGAIRGPRQGAEEPHPDGGGAGEKASPPQSVRPFLSPLMTIRILIDPKEGRSSGCTPAGLCVFLYRCRHFYLHFCLCSDVSATFSCIISCRSFALWLLEVRHTEDCLAAGCRRTAAPFLLQGGRHASQGDAGGAAAGGHPAPAVLDLLLGRHGCVQWRANSLALQAIVAPQ